jgi:hypothetical protein
MYYNQKSSLENSTNSSENATNSSESLASSFDIANESYGLDSNNKIMYCYASFPSVNFEIALTIYTVIISYVLPLLTIIFCYARMIKKIVSSSHEKEAFELKYVTTRRSSSQVNRNVNVSFLFFVSYACFNLDICI